jgi:AmiR/NasT family two-component response regulator
MSQPRSRLVPAPELLLASWLSPRLEVPVVTEPALSRSEEDHLTDLPATRAVIEQAKGILIATYRCGPDEAAELLRRASRGGGVKIHVLAARLIEVARRGLMDAEAGHDKA